MKYRIIDILNQFGIDEEEYSVTVEEDRIGFLFTTNNGHSVRVEPITIKVYFLEVDREWTMAGVSSENVPLVAATALATLLRQYQGCTACIQAE